MRHALVAPEAHEPVAQGRHVHVHLAALRAGACVQPQRAAVADLPAEVGIVDDGEVPAAAPSLALAAAAAAAATAAAGRRRRRRLPPGRRRRRRRCCRRASRRAVARCGEVSRTLVRARVKGEGEARCGCGSG